MTDRCQDSFTSGRPGNWVTVFCAKRKGHKGDHRGQRKQWNRKGKQVPITEEMPKR